MGRKKPPSPPVGLTWALPTNLGALHVLTWAYVFAAVTWAYVLAAVTRGEAGQPQKHDTSTAGRASPPAPPPAPAMFRIRSEEAGLLFVDWGPCANSPTKLGAAICLLWIRSDEGGQLAGGRWKV